MGKIYNLFSQSEAPPSTHSVKTANELLPVILKLTKEAAERADQLTARLQNFSRDTKEFKALCKEYDALVEEWSEKIHRLGAVAKGLWLVDFDTGTGYLCWAYPETRVEHFHSYDSGYKHREKIH